MKAEIALRKYLGLDDYLVPASKTFFRLPCFRGGLWRYFKAEEIGERLFIGVNTVNSHKKRIKEVLETTSNRDLMQYAKAFDLS